MNILCSASKQRIKAKYQGKAQTTKVLLFQKSKQKSGQVQQFHLNDAFAEPSRLNKSFQIIFAEISLYFTYQPGS